MEDNQHSNDYSYKEPVLSTENNTGQQPFDYNQYQQYLDHINQSNHNNNNILHGVKVGAFRRYFARALDQSLYVTILFIFINLATTNQMKVFLANLIIVLDSEDPTLFSLVAFLAISFGLLAIFLTGAILAEGFMISKFGCTLGKKILKLKVTKPDGTNLTFKEGIVRTFMVFAQCYALWIIEASFILQIIWWIGYNKKGRAEYDKKLMVVGEELGGLSIFLFIIVQTILWVASIGCLMWYILDLAMLVTSVM